MIELIVTLLVIAVIASISVGSIVDIRSRTPRQVMTDIEQLFALAGDEAAITGTIKGLFVESGNRLALRDYARENTSEDNVAGAFSGLLNSIASVNESANASAAGDGATFLEDRGAFAQSEKAGWSTLIYSLQLPEDYMLESQVVAAAGQQRVTDQEVPDPGAEEDPAIADEPLIRFFPDGSVLPGGSLTLLHNQQRVQLDWDTSGNLTVID